MAKIILVCKEFHPTTRQLAWALHHQKHEVTILTSKNVVPDDKMPFQFMAYFQKWSALEALKLLPRLLQSPPDIWHFVFHFHKDLPLRAQGVLALFAQSLPRRMVATSLYTTPRARWDWQWKLFFQSCDLVTVGTRENLMSLKRRQLIPHKTVTEVIPPLQSHEFDFSEEHKQDLEQFCTQAKPFLFIPSNKISDSVLDKITRVKFSAVLFRQRPAFNLKPGIFYLSERIEDSDLIQLAKSSSALLLAFSSYSVYELLRWQRLSELSGTPLIVNPYQVECLPGLALNEKTGWVLENGEASLDWLLRHKDLRSAKPLPHTSSKALIDSSMNGLNRLYMQILDKKQLSLESSHRPSH